MPAETQTSPDAPVIRTHLSGYDLLLHPELNKGTAFTEEERTMFALHGLLPPHIGTLDEQRERRQKALAEQPTSFARYTFMRDLQDSDEVLFYSLIAHNTEDLLPVVYTPAVGEGCQRFSEIWRKPRGLFISYPNRHMIDQMLAHPRYNHIRCIVVSDGERILGLGDQGAGGMGIPIGKMALYTALGGIPPQHCLPMLLDVGTDNQALLNNPIYIGWQHHRVRGQEYDDFIEAFVNAVQRRWPHILLQWEDFAGENALRILGRYRDRLCTFNDDVQGTAAVTTGALLAAVNATGVPLRDQRIAMFGSGSAGVGIIALLVAALKEQGVSDIEARQRIYAFNRHGLIVEGDPGLRASQIPLARTKDEIATWKLTNSGPVSLRDTVKNAGITALVGVSAQAGVFTEEIVRTMARNTPRPVIFPLSNPTSKSEAAPEDLFHWTQGKVIVGTGSPFPPVDVNGRSVRISQINNSFIFPGLALGILVSRAARVSQNMMMAAAKALARQSPTVADNTAPLLPRVAESRQVAIAVAEAVARQASADGLSEIADPSTISDAIRAYAWNPVYPPYERIYLHAQGSGQESPDFAI